MARRSVGSVAAAALCSALVLAACGGSDSSQPPPSGAGADIDIGTPINLADCNDWNDASVDERLGTIREIRNFTGQEVAGSGGASGSTLADEDAYELFETYCENEYARAFKLYKLYGRAAAFGGS